VRRANGKTHEPLFTGLSRPSSAHSRGDTHIAVFCTYLSQVMRSVRQCAPGGIGTNSRSAAQSNNSMMTATMATYFHIAEAWSYSRLKVCLCLGICRYSTAPHIDGELSQVRAPSLSGRENLRIEPIEQHRVRMKKHQPNGPQPNGYADNEEQSDADTPQPAHVSRIARASEIDCDKASANSPRTISSI
jgi:hypothetical protein